MSEANPTPTPTASETRAAWMAQVTRDLKGADFGRRLVSPTLEGGTIEPLYDATTTDAVALASRPSVAPWATGGWRVGMDLSGLSAGQIASVIGHEGLEGVDRVVVDGAGASAAELKELATALAAAGVELALQGASASTALALGANAASRLEFAVDPAHALWSGSEVGAVSAALGEAADALVNFDTRKSVFVFGASSVGVHDQGGSLAHELAVNVLVASEWVRAITARGASARLVTDGLVMRIAVGREFLREVARVRALRRLWAHVLASADLLSDDIRLNVAAFTSRRVQTARDPWTNLLRSTVATMAAGAGGVDSLTVRAFDAELGDGTELGRRLARNTQQIAIHESRAAAVTDPAAGSWAIEQLTDDLCAAAWACVQRVEQAGGLLSAPGLALLSAEIATVAAKRRDRIARRLDPITGVSEYALLGERLRPQSGQPDPRPRDASPFEELRARADVLGAAARVAVATVGARSTWSARADWVTNLLAAGGMAAELVDIDEVSDGIASVAVLVGDDACYDLETASAVARLRGCGVHTVWRAGKPADEAAARGAGIDGFVHVGIDVVSALTTVLDQLTRGTR